MKCSEDDARTLAAVAAEINLVAQRRDTQISGRLSPQKHSIANDWG
nr:hypothetical protein [Brucella abortus]